MSTESRFHAIEAGFSGDEKSARAFLAHEDPDVRASALRALSRIGVISPTELSHALKDPDTEVRRSAVELSALQPEVVIHHLLNDEDVFVAEMTAWSLGERTSITDHEIAALIHNATAHVEPVVRESCAAALGSLGDIRGLPAILSACTDKPAVRRRAVLALAPFDGDEVEVALQRALEDNDWQVRQNAEILLNPRD